MTAIRALYDGKSIIPQEPIPVNGAYKVVITFTEPVEKKQSTEELLKFCGLFDNNDVDTMLEIIKERENFSLGRPEL
jgi:hypothetical protein